MGEPSICVIDGFELIGCEHLYGPSYRLSAIDLEVFRTRCREIQEGNKIRVAGFFRSATGDTFRVLDEDRSAIRELAPDAAVMVLVKPHLNGNADFRVYQPGEDGEWRETEEFEVKTAFPPAPARAAAAVTPAAHPAQLAGQQPAKRESGGRSDEALSRGRALATMLPRSPWAIGVTAFFVVFGLLALVAASVFAARGLWKPQVQQARSDKFLDLGMQVIPQGDTLKLVWDRGLAPVQDAVSGTLQIFDGDQDRIIELDKTQVAQAVIYYSPKSNDVTFRLTVHGRQPKPLSGIARILVSGKDGAGAPLTADRVAPEQLLPVPVRAEASLRPKYPHRSFR